MAIGTIGDYLAEGAIAVNARRVVTYVNRIAIGLLGTPGDALIGRDIATVLGPRGDPGRRFERAMTEVLERGVEQVLTVNDADAGGPFNVDYCRLVPIADGGALILLGETMSPTVPEQVANVRTRTTRAVHERERMLAAALETMDQPVFVLSLERRVLYANAAAVREYGYSLEELTSMSIDRLVASAVPLRPGADIAGTSANLIVAEQAHRRHDGSQFPAAVALSFIRQDSGVTMGYVLSVRNLTDERRIAEQLRQSEKLATLGELVAGVAHELNNPLAGISAFAQLLLEERLDDDQRESARLIKREADRAVSVIRDLLLFSRKAGPSTDAVDVNSLVQLTLRLRAYSLRSSGVEVETHLGADVSDVAGDDQTLQQVILNLIVNAEYAMRHSTTRRLVIRTARERDIVTIAVSDTGTGMSDETLQRVFEPFFTTKPPGEGTGLGLSVSYGIIEAHGGTIAVESAPGRGSTFRVVLPAHDRAEATESSA